MNSLIECVPNFSEGRDAAVLARLREAIESQPGVALLDFSADQDHNRSVFTFAGPGEAVAQAAVAAAGVAVACIDLRRHRGVHPRIGAADVIPFVPLGRARMNECVGLARRTAARLWERWELPCYLYGDAALRPERRRLEVLRKGGFEALIASLPADEQRRPDVGGPAPHPTAGVSAVGVRKILIAWNVDLNTADVNAAKQIARAIRESSGGLPHVKALGLLLEHRGRAQVSMNLTDYERTPMHVVYRRIEQEARRLGVTIAGGEFIGLVPRAMVEAAQREGVAAGPVRKEQILEARLARFFPEWDEKDAAL